MWKGKPEEPIGPVLSHGLTSSHSGWKCCSANRSVSSLYLATLCLVPEPLLAQTATCILWGGGFFVVFFSFLLALSSDARWLFLVTDGQAVSGYLPCSVTLLHCINPERRTGWRRVTRPEPQTCLLWILCRIQSAGVGTCFCTCSVFSRSWNWLHWRREMFVFPALHVGVRTLICGCDTMLWIVNFWF